MKAPPPPIQLIAPEPMPPHSKGDESNLEQKQLFSGDKWRDESLKQVLHTAIIWGLRLAALCLIGCFIVRVIHLAAPEFCLWLSPERLQKLDSILFSGALGAFVSRYIGQATTKSNQTY